MSAFVRAAIVGFGVALLSMWLFDSDGTFGVAVVALWQANRANDALLRKRGGP